MSQIRGEQISGSVATASYIDPIFISSSAAAYGFGSGGGGGAAFPYIGNAVISGSLLVSGSSGGSSGITGSLYGTASWAENALTASSLPDGITINGNFIGSLAGTAQYASYVDGNIFDSTNPVLSASYASTATDTRVKSGVVSDTSFHGLPYSASVSLGTAYSDTTYAVTVVGEDLRAWSVSNKEVGSFILHTNSSTPLTAPVNWISSFYAVASPGPNIQYGPVQHSAYIDASDIANATGNTPSSLNGKVWVNLDGGVSQSFSSSGIFTASFCKDDYITLTPTYTPGPVPFYYKNNAITSSVSSSTTNMGVQCGSTVGRIFYVSDTLGSDTYSTTQAQNQNTPWKTLAKIQNISSTLLPGDYVLFKCGDIFAGTLQINTSGTAAAPITFGAYGSGNKPKFIGTGATITQLVYLYNRSYITFDNLWITDPTLSTTDRTQLAKIQRAFTFDGVAGTNGFCKITNCDISLVGVGFYTKTNYNTMQGCDIGNLRMIVSDATVDNDYGANPIVIASSNNNVLSNYYHDCWANSIDYTTDGGAIELYSEGSTRPVSNNFIAYNTFYDNNGGIEVGGANTASILDNNTFAYNKFINNGGALLIQNSGLYAAQITNVKLHNNVFVESRPATPPMTASTALIRFRVTSSVANSIIFKNNVVQIYGTMTVGRVTQNAQQLSGSQFVHENNVYKLNTSGSGTTLNFTASASEYVTSSVLWQDTSNTNPLYWSYTPTGSSILINNGQSLGYTRDFGNNIVSSPPEIGIIEYNPPVNP